MDKRIGEHHGDFTIIAKSTKAPNGYLNFYWAKCKCGNLKRLRYDYIRKGGNCGLCSDFIESGVLKAFEGLNNGNE